MTPFEGTRLKLLGAPGLDGPGRDPSAILSQPKRLALLAYLAVHGGWVRRDALVPMFWSDLDADRARRALSQALHVLRRSLGSDVVRTRGAGEIGVSASHLWCDVRAFESACNAGRWDEALHMYGGTLLRGLDGEQVTPEFARWLESTRLRLQKSAAGAARQLADEAFHAGNVEGAIAWQRKAVDIRPVDETMFREYVALLDESGDAALALSEYEAFRTRLRNEFDLEPAIETVRLVELIRSRRPESESAVPSAPRETADGGLAPVAPHEAGSSPRIRLSLFRVLAAVPVLIFLSLGWRAIVDEPAAPPPAVVPNRIAVLYLNPFDDSVASYIADGITGALIDNLSEYANLEVVPSWAVSEYRHTRVGLDSLVEALHAAFYVTGNVRRLGDEVQVTVELATSDGANLSNQNLTFEDPNVVEISESVIQVIVDRLRLVGEDIERREIQYGTQDAEAAALALQALALEQRAIEHMKPSTSDLVPDLLAQADSLLAVAIHRDRNWSRPVLQRGRLAETRLRLCYPEFVQCDWREAVRDGLKYATRVIEMEPASGAAFELRASIRWMGWLFGAVTDTAELSYAISDLKAAVTASRPEPSAYGTLSQIYMQRGEWKEAYAAAEMALEADEFARDQSRNLADLFEAAFVLHRDSAAHAFCDSLIALKRNSFREVSCELQLRAWTEELTPDVRRARRIADAYIALVSGTEPSDPQPQTELLVAMVMAAAAGDDIEAQDHVAAFVQQIVTSNPETDDRLLYAAGAMARLGKIAEAQHYLRRYIAGNPAKRFPAPARRWFETIDMSDVVLYPPESGK